MHSQIPRPDTLPGCKTPAALKVRSWCQWVGVLDGERVSAVSSAYPSCPACPGRGHFRIPEMEETLCHAWQRAGEVATESGRRQPQRPGSEASVNKDTPRTDLAQIGGHSWLEPSSRHARRTPTRCLAGLEGGLLKPFPLLRRNYEERSWVRVRDSPVRPSPL